MSERVKTVFLCLVLAVVVMFTYLIIMPSYVHPSRPPTTAVKGVFPPSTKDTPKGQVQGHMTQEDIFGQWKARKVPPAENATPKTVAKSKKYAVISSSTPLAHSNPKSYNYVFDLPLTVIAWQRIGFKSIVFITGSKAKWEALPILALVYSYLKDLEAVVVFIDAKPENLVMLSQTSRLFACCVKGIEPGDYILTSDSDLWPINGEKYQLPPGKSLLNTNAYCCGYFTHNSEKFLMLPLSNFGANASTWQSIMFGTQDCFNLTSEAILDYFAAEFGSSARTPVIKGENIAWYFDQRMASIRTEQWIRTHNDTSVLEFATRNTHKDRLDRSRWDLRYLGSMIDTHFLEHLYRGEQWARMQPVLIMLYGEGSTYFSLCQRYYQDFVAEMKAQLNVSL